MSLSLAKCEADKVGIMKILLPPNAEQQKNINYELDPNPPTLQRDLQAIREWLDKQPHLPHHIDDARLERFLYGCKFSLERTKTLLDAYYTVRAGVPEFFQDRDPRRSDIQKCCKDIYYCTTPRLTPSGYRLSVLRLNDQDAHNFNISTIVKRVLITMDIRLNEERCLNNVIVFDLRGFTAQHFAKCSPTVPAFRKMMLCIQDAFPMRIAQIHLINAPVILEKVMSVLTPLLKEKLVQKFFIHSQLDTLYKYIPMEFLPKEYGGSVGTMKDINDAWTRKMEEYRDWLLEDEPRSRADETRRPNRKKSNANSSALFLNDVEGSFRQLSID
uniref:CRAL-TRIO domain-containing protein n=1 Tax=Timema shepardi TaxID=629360 RepID=A0A7R9FWC4_TIMSH|nr:unnamed protein product [Timema shepardi]